MTVEKMHFEKIFTRLRIKYYCLFWSDYYLEIIFTFSPSLYVTLCLKVLQDHTLCSYNLGFFKEHRKFMNFELFRGMSTYFTNKGIL